MSLELQSRPLKYRMIEAALRKFVDARAAGERLPSERELAKTFKCNALTVRKSMGILVEEGRIVRRTGSGTFVARRDLGEGVIAACLPKGGKRIGTLISHDSDAYGLNVMQAVALAAKRQAIELRSAWVHGYGTEAVQMAEVLKTGGCGAVILPWFPPQQAGEIESFVRRSPLPVCLPQPIPGMEANCFERADVFGKSMLASTEGLCQYFRRLGHRRIAMLGPDEPGNAILQAKLTVYSCYVSREGLENLSGLVGETSGSVDALARRWKAYKGELAVVCYDDTHALRFITAMHKLGLSAPGDFAIIGYNNIEASITCDPPLTTVGQNFEYIGRGMLASALALAEGTVRQSAQILPQLLVMRESCGGRGRLRPEWAGAFSGLVLDLGTGAHVPGEASGIVQSAAMA